MDMSRSSESVGKALARLRRIEGRHNPLVKQLRLAFSRAQLTEEGDCAIEGLRIVEEAIRSGLRVRAVYFRETSHGPVERLIPQIGGHVETLLLPDSLFDSIVPSETPQGVAAFVHLKGFSLDDILERLQVGPIVMPVGLQDPGNLGTILRSAEAFGSAGMIAGEGTVSPFNWKAVRASAGSLFRVPLIYRNRESTAAKSDDFLDNLRARRVRLIATSSHKGTVLDRADLKTPCAIVFGNEGSGLSRQLMARIDEIVAIPHAPQVESLNAGVAASIVLYEAARQRSS